MEDSSNNMLVSEPRLIELLTHQNKIVRDEAVSALERYFPKSPNVIKPILKAFHIYKGDTLSLIRGIKSFSPDEADIRVIHKLLIEIMDKKDENSVNTYFHLMNCLSQFPYDLIAAVHESFIFNEQLQKNYEIITNRNQIKSRSPKILWTELSDICKQHQGKYFDNHTREYVDVLVEGLAQHDDEIQRRIIMFFNQEITDHYFELYTVRLAGELKVRETIPCLFKILIDSDYMDLVNDECTSALEKIGGWEVADQVERLYPDHKEIRPQLASILKSIPYSYSEDLAIRLLKNEADIEQKTYLAEALCGMFSLKAAGLILQIIEHQQYDPSILCLSDLLVPVYEYHHQAYNLADLQRKDQQYFQERMDNDPIHQSLSQLTDNLMKLADEEKPKNKTGRNDPCPCGSGKKYKKCCLLKPLSMD